eukprot:TRINITY_DN14737_c0_g2_i3.p1 TRINITY_DN14737_c0_g2~~TRINITY_DN14737_c0_g2_i3.p1  ORF type:complete len:258 (+),score=60.70 TRINITY_DN14737_c0_g2_i3:139-912(+)
MLRSLVGSEMCIRDSPQTLPDLANLKRLYMHSALHQCHADAIAILLRMENLVELNLSNNELFSDSEPEHGLLPLEFGTALAGLESLGLSGNMIECLENCNFHELTRLTFLDLSNNRLSQVPELMHLSKLTSLNLKGNTLMSLPALDSLHRLESLICSCNRLVELPSLAPLVNVQFLDLSQNHIHQLGNDIAHCVSLVDLVLSQNQLEVLPIELASIPNLERAFLDKNPLQMLPQEFEKFVGTDCMTDLRRQVSESLF